MTESDSRKRSRPCDFSARSDKKYRSDHYDDEENDCTLSIYSYGYSDSESLGDDSVSRRSESVSTTSSLSRPTKRHRRFSKHRSSSHKPLRSISRSRSNSRSLSKQTRSRSRSFGVLPLEYWERTLECQEAKFQHMEKLDRLCESREALVLNTTLYDCDIALEKNMFPYNTPKGVEHYTLWSRSDMVHQEICDYVNSWLRRNMPNAMRWNYDDNFGEKSIQLFHVHVYIESPLPARHDN